MIFVKSTSGPSLTYLCKQGAKKHTKGGGGVKSNGWEVEAGGL